MSEWQQQRAVLVAIKDQLGMKGSRIFTAQCDAIDAALAHIAKLETALLNIEQRCEALDNPGYDVKLMARQARAAQRAGGEDAG